ncbi:MAG TPA: DUF4440 domain-containing protein [Kofleriaceae bacterium]|nr:DUF4440 domain-containing protein [Kofleriaceae bacterium]
MRSKLWPSVLVTCAASCAPTGVRAPADSAPVLRQYTQEMLDAIAAGDRAPWDRYLDPAVLYVSEAGDVEDKPRLLAELVPLPAGITGHIELGRFEVRAHGDTAVVFHADEETEIYFGHELHAEYLNVATWRHTAAGWRVIAQQVYASLRDPPAIALPAAQLDDYVGTYALTDAIHYTIRRDGDHLIGQRDGRPAQPLLVEARDVLFVAGQPRSRKVFGRDAAGKVVQFADRREARDVVWPRVSPP